MSVLLTLECPNCGEEKHMINEDYEYRGEKDIGIECVHCKKRSETKSWEEIGRH